MMKNPEIFLRFSIKSAVFLALPLLFCVSAMAQGKEQASGSLTIGEGATAQKIELKHVYAAREYGEADRPILLTFTDKPLPTDPVERVKYLAAMSRAGKLNVLQVEIYRKEVQSSYVMCGACQTASHFSGSKIYYNNREEDELREEDDEQIFDLKTLDAETISGTVHSTLVYDYDALQEWRIRDGSEDDSDESSAKKQMPKAAYQYRVTFNAALRKEREMARVLPEGGGEAGKAYLAFHNAVVAANASEIRRWLSASAQKKFSGSAAQVARLKSLVEPYKLIGQSTISKTGKFALMNVQDIPHDIPHEARKDLPKPDSLIPVYGDPLFTIPMPPPPPAPAMPTSPMSTPPPPPPPPPGAGKSARTKSPRGGVPGWAPGGVRGGVPGGIPGGAYAPPTRYPVTGEVRLVSEGGQWKVEWLFLDHATDDLLSQLDTYKTREERYTEMAKAEAEARRKEEEESWKIENAKPLPAGGGEAGKAYLEFCQSERTGNKKQMVKYLTGAQFDLYNNPGLTITKGAFIWKESSALDYSNIEIVSGMANAEEAVLEVKAIRLGYRTTGKVFMILEEGQWKVNDESWQTDTSKKVQ